MNMPGPTHRVSIFVERFEEEPEGPPTDTLEQVPKCPPTPLKWRLTIARRLIAKLKKGIQDLPKTRTNMSYLIEISEILGRMISMKEAVEQGSESYITGSSDHERCLKRLFEISDELGAQQDGAYQDGAHQASRASVPRWLASVLNAVKGWLCACFTTPIPGDYHRGSDVTAQGIPLEDRPKRSRGGGELRVGSQ